MKYLCYTLTCQKTHHQKYSNQYKKLKKAKKFTTQNQVPNLTISKRRKCSTPSPRIYYWYICVEHLSKDTTSTINKDIRWIQQIDVAQRITTKSQVSFLIISKHWKCSTLNPCSNILYSLFSLSSQFLPQLILFFLPFPLNWSLLMLKHSVPYIFCRNN